MSEIPSPEIQSLGGVPSPALLFDANAIERNIDLMISIAGGNTSCLRPHIKTHKCAEILKLQLDRGISQVKCATIAEGELAAQAGVPDILISYPLVGPNAARLAQLAAQYPDSQFSALVDSAEGLRGLEANAHKGASIFLDLDCGMHRTGIASGDVAVNLVRDLVESERLQFAGIHAYDGHIHDASLSGREQAFALAMGELDDFLARLSESGIEVPLIVSGGSPTFALHAAKANQSERSWQCSPGTTLLWDSGYGEHYPDLAFELAALLLTRVVSHPGDTFVCLDLGHKAVSAENPIHNRVRFPKLQVEKFVSQSEEHLVVELSDRSVAPVGSELIGIPYHVCPTVALYQRARIIRDGICTDETWEISARDRRLTI